MFWLSNSTYMAFTCVCKTGRTYIHVYLALIKNLANIIKFNFHLLSFLHSFYFILARWSDRKNREIHLWSVKRDYSNSLRVNFNLNSDWIVRYTGHLSKMDQWTKWEKCWILVSLEENFQKRKAFKSGSIICNYYGFITLSKCMFWSVWIRVSTESSLIRYKWKLHLWILLWEKWRGGKMLSANCDRSCPNNKGLSCLPYLHSSTLIGSLMIPSCARSIAPFSGFLSNPSCYSWL